jgi:2-oxoglutarate ferredoxin oxidoreductase subunit beta
MAPIDPVSLGLSLGATFIARSFSGDKVQLVPILKAAIAHRGFALLDVISPCVTFNDHEGSTKSYLYTREHQIRLTQADFIPPAEEITATVPPDGVTNVVMHDGSLVRFRAVPEGYDPTDRNSVLEYLAERQQAGEVATGLLYVDEAAEDVHGLNRTSATPLNRLPYEKLCPGSVALERLQEGFR